MAIAIEVSESKTRERRGKLEVSGNIHSEHNPLKERLKALYALRGTDVDMTLPEMEITRIEWKLGRNNGSMLSATRRRSIFY